MPAQFCHQDAPFLTTVKLLSTYIIPKADVQVSATLRSQPPIIFSVNNPTVFVGIQPTQPAANPTDANWNVPNTVVQSLLGRLPPGGLANGVTNVPLLDNGNLIFGDSRRKQDAYEAIWGHGGSSMTDDGRLALDTEAARQALAFLRGTVERGLSPRTVLSASEEESRRAFQSGRAVFMRNWPYAWTELQGEGSVVRGKVAVSPLPTASGAPGSGAIGGWQLAVNARSPSHRRDAALRRPVGRRRR